MKSNLECPAMAAKKLVLERKPPEHGLKNLL